MMITLGGIHKTYQAIVPLFSRPRLTSTSLRSPHPEMNSNSSTLEVGADPKDDRGRLPSHYAVGAICSQFLESGTQETISSVKLLFAFLFSELDANGRSLWLRQLLGAGKAESCFLPSASNASFETEAPPGENQGRQLITLCLVLVQIYFFSAKHDVQLNAVTENEENRGNCLKQASNVISIC